MSEMMVTMSRPTCQQNDLRSPPISPTPPSFLVDQEEPHLAFSTLCDHAFDGVPDLSARMQKTSTSSEATYVPVAARSMNDDVISEAISASPIIRKPQRHIRRGMKSDDFFTDPATHDLLPSLPADSTIREFNHWRQSTRLLGSAFWHLVSTIFLCEITAATMGGFYVKESVTQMDRMWFNALVTALPLFIGLSVASWLRSSAHVLRWKILASSHWTPRQFDILLGAAEPINVLRLMFNARQGQSMLAWLVIELCSALWLLLTVIGPLIIAMLGFTYTFEQSSISSLRAGKISLLDLRNESLVNDVSRFGNVVWDQATGSFGDHKDWMTYLEISLGEVYYDASRAAGHATSFYRFRANNPADSSLTVLSNRSISSYVECAENVWKGEVAPGVDPGGWRNSDHSGSQYLATKKSPSCGDRCDMVFVFPGNNSDTYWICNNTISSVEYLSGGRSSLDMPDASARTLASSIANTSNPAWSTKQAIREADIIGCYYTDSYWAVDVSAELGNIAVKVSQFALTVLAASDRGEETSAGQPYFSDSNTHFSIPGSRPLGPRANITGDGLEQPYYPTHLKINWKYAIPIIVSVPLLQALASLIIIWYTSDVIVKDGSFFSMTNLLAPCVIQGIGDHGCLLRGEDITRLLGDHTMTMTYGTEVREDGLNHTGVVQGALGGMHEKQHFAEGPYD